MRFTATVLFLAIFYCGCGAKPDVERKSNGVGTPAVNENWKRVNEEYITFAIPRTLTKEVFTPIDTPNYVYSSKTITVDISIGENAPRLSYFREHFDFAAYSEKNVELKGVLGTQADLQFVEGKTLFAYPDRVFAKVVEIPCSSEDFRVSFLILYTNRSYDNIAQTIVDSISVNCPPGRE